MSFYINLSKISIDEFKKMLQTMDLIPSWKILLDDIDENFRLIKQQCINNLEELFSALKNKDKLHQFSNQSHISIQYLTVLNRIVKGYIQKPVKLKEFIWIERDIIEKLEKAGIKDTLMLYDKVLTSDNRNKLSNETDVSQADILILTKLADLTRIRWVNHTFAYVLLLAGYDTAQKVANADPCELYEGVKKANKENNVYNAHIGLNDMKMCIDSAKLLDFDIAY